MGQLAEGLLSLSGWAAATVWAVAHVQLGYAAGVGWRQVHHLSGRVGLLLGGAVLVVLAVAWLLRRLARRHDEPRQPGTSGGAATAELGAVGRQPWVARGSEAPEPGPRFSSCRLPVPGCSRLLLSRRLRAG
jgi:hypothetical protein